MLRLHKGRTKSFPDLGRSDLEITSVLIIVIPAQAGTQWRRFLVFAVELTFAGSRDNQSQSHWVTRFARPFGAALRAFYAQALVRPAPE
jgi:hypothetical protein